MNVKIPKVVMDEAAALVGQYGENIVLLGHKDVWDVYMFQFPEGSLTGFPYIFIYDREDESIDTVTGFDALDIIAEFEKQ